MLWSHLLQKMIAQMTCNKTVCPDSEGGNGEKNGLGEETEEDIDHSLQHILNANF